MFFYYESDRRLVGRDEIISKKKHRETKFIFSTGLMGGMFFYYESDREVSRECTIN